MHGERRVKVLDSVPEIFKDFIKPFFSRFFGTNIFPSGFQVDPD